MEQFLKELNEKYTLEDFTGHLGVLLADENTFADEEEYELLVNSALDFLQEVLDIASKNLH